MSNQPRKPTPTPPSILTSTARRAEALAELLRVDGLPGYAMVASNIAADLRSIERREQRTLRLVS